MNRWYYSLEKLKSDPKRKKHSSSNINDNKNRKIISWSQWNWAKKVINLLLLFIGIVNHYFTININIQTQHKKLKGWGHNHLTGMSNFRLIFRFAQVCNFWMWASICQKTLLVFTGLCLVSEKNKAKISSQWNST